jgi:hypothetical protein
MICFVNTKNHETHKIAKISLEKVKVKKKKGIAIPVTGCGDP